MQCPYCEQEHADGAAFCPMTGKALNACKKCQSILDPNWKICPRCGTPVHDDHNKVGVKKQKQGNKFVRTFKLILYGFLSLIALLLIITLTSLFFDPFGLHLRGRLFGQYDAAATVMPDKTQVYVGINLLHLKQKDIDLLTNLLSRPVALEPTERYAFNVESLYEYSTSKTASEVPVNMVAQPVKSFVSAAQADYGIKFPDDLMPWVGQYLGVGIVEIPTDISLSPRLLITAEARDRRAADRFLNRLIREYQGGYSESFDHRGVVVHMLVNDVNQETLAFCRSGSMVMFALDNKTIREALDTISANSLSNNPVFIELMKRYPNNHLINAYITRGAVDSFTNAGPAAALIGLFALPSTSLTSWQGAFVSAGLDNDQIQLDVHSLIDRRSLSGRDRRFLAQSGSPGKTADLLPEETVVYLTGFRTDLLWETFTENLIAADKHYDILASVRNLELIFGMNMQDDLIKYMDDEWAVGLVKAGEGSRYAIGYIIMARIENTQPTMTWMNANMQAQPMSSYIAASEINRKTFYQINNPATSDRFSLFGFEDEYFIAGSDPDCIEKMLVKKTALSETAPYRSMRNFSTNVSPVLYVNVKELLPLILDGKTGLTYDRAFPILTLFDTVYAVQYPLDGDVIKNTFNFNFAARE
jgi:hypothetical protein